MGAGLLGVGEILSSAPAGHVANAYEQSRAPVATIIGPTGSGKTIASCRKYTRVARWQDPSPRDGIRRARIAVIGRTYPDLWDKPMKSYVKVYPERVFGKIVGARNRQADHHIRIREPVDMTNPIEAERKRRWPAYGTIDIEVWFRAINDIDLEEFARGLEVTAWHLTEMDTLPQDLVGIASNRTGRYPEPEDRFAPEDRLSIGLTEKAYGGVFGDANVPDIDDWFYNEYWLTGKRPKHWHLYRQPPGLIRSPTGEMIQNPEAENLQNLRKIDPDYYPNKAKDQKDWQNRRFFECKPGYSRHGKPVHEDFDELRHVPTTRVKADPHLPVIIGVDSGANTLMPAAVFMQRALDGQWRVLGSVSPTSQMTIQELGIEILRFMAVHVGRCKGAVIIGDPALQQKSALNGVTFAMLLQDNAKIEVQLASSNKPDARRGALKKVLRTHNRFVVDPVLGIAVIKSLAGGFQLKKDPVTGILKPVKNVHSHTGEACEYGVMGGDGVDGSETDMLGLNGSWDDAALSPAPVM